MPLNQSHPFISVAGVVAVVCLLLLLRCCAQMCPLWRVPDEEVPYSCSRAEMPRDDGYPWRTKRHTCSRRVLPGPCRDLPVISADYVTVSARERHDGFLGDTVVHGPVSGGHSACGNDLGHHKRQDSWHFLFSL